MADEPQRPNGSNTPPEHSPWALAGLGMQFFVAILVFVYAGSWLDRRLDSSPLFLLSGLFFGGGGAFYASYRRLMKPRKPSANDDHDPSLRS